MASLVIRNGKAVAKLVTLMDSMHSFPLPPEVLVSGGDHGAKVIESPTSQMRFCCPRSPVSVQPWLCDSLASGPPGRPRPFAEDHSFRMTARAQFGHRASSGILTSQHPPGSALLASSTAPSCWTSGVDPPPSGESFLAALSRIALRQCLALASRKGRCSTGHRSATANLCCSKWYACHR